MRASGPENGGGHRRARSSSIAGKLIGHSFATWLEQFDRITRRIIDQNLFPARTGNDLTAKVRAGLRQFFDPRCKIACFKHQPIPAARQGLGAIGKWTRRRTARTAKP